MFQISFKVKYKEVDEIIEKLQIIDLYSTYYDAPFQVTTDSNGYGFYEKEDEDIILNVFPDAAAKDECNEYIEKIGKLLNIDLSDITLTELPDEGWQQPFEPVYLNNGWVIAEPEAEVSCANKINFISQGSFGTGLHETTQDLLRYILSEDFTDLSVLDLGTGSGILSIAAGIRNAAKIIALDIRDVTEEVLFNASLNKLTNIEVVIEDVTKSKTSFQTPFDVIFINIGGEETLSSIGFINSVIKHGGTLYVSGLVEWSFKDILTKLEAFGYNLLKHTQTNEWVTMILKASC
ncbi:50S ribosomal protein L11 methyltransferase [Clostridium oryzae]|uniref:Ribosomal protein L11 methyltransferase n=1 Tax=Clostridium oryzae TaxID=1450648 RepID=A0A1V4IIG2_9CLOT|nr:50S ribosomal protein L11 methyltransferase [Clostridium oryzae]OPJ59287.1 ribosomal protein L11 methyltransferase [Clostridium oryzae]